MNMNWKSLDSLINQFDFVIHENEGIGGALTFFLPGHTWANKWRLAAEIQEGFNSNVQYPEKAERDEAWQKFYSLRGELARRSKEDKDWRQHISGLHKSQILWKVGNSKPDNFFGFSIVDVEKMKMYGAKLNEAGTMLSENKHEMLGEDKQECFEAIHQMREEHNIWWESLHAEKDKRHSDFKARVKHNLEQNYERLQKAKDALGRFRDQADKLREEIVTAWSEDWRERREGWLAELEDRIIDIEQSILRIETWIEEDETKLK